METDETMIQQDWVDLVENCQKPQVEKVITDLPAMTKVKNYNKVNQDINLPTTTLTLAWQY